MVGFFRLWHGYSKYGFFPFFSSFFLFCSQLRSVCHILITNPSSSFSSYSFLLFLCASTSVLYVEDWGGGSGALMIPVHARLVDGGPRRRNSLLAQIPRIFSPLVFLYQGGIHIHQTGSDSTMNVTAQRLLCFSRLHFFPHLTGADAVGLIDSSAEKYDNNLRKLKCHTIVCRKNHLIKYFFNANPLKKKIYNNKIFAICFRPLIFSFTKCHFSTT